MRRATGRIQPRVYTAVRWVMTALVVTVIAHQFVMLLPAHEHVMAMIAPAPHTATAESHPCDAMCPPATIKQCAMTEAAFRAVLAFVLALVVLTLLPVAAAALTRVCRSSHEWLWSLNRRRAFLQVFLC